MFKVLVNIYSWERPKVCRSDIKLEKGDTVIVRLKQSLEIGEVLNADAMLNENPEEKVERVASERDLKNYQENQKKKKEYLKICREEIKKAGLEMKLVDGALSLDGKQIVFVFTSDGRIDFRELVKNVSRQIKKSVRMQQIGSRDEAKNLGGYGICGRELCCVRFKGSIQSITTDMARAQQVAHRGAERISGLCGRLMCCLAYEAEQYREMLKGMPELYSTVKTSKGKGTVMEIIPEKQELKIKLEKGEYIMIKKSEIKE